MRLYLIGSLRNPEVPALAERLRTHGHDVFDDWFAAGPEADDWWQKYEQARGHTYAQGLSNFAADHVFKFDKHHLDKADGGVLLLPAGKSGHLELGYLIGQGKPCYILLASKEPERWDVMYKFATGVFNDEVELVHALAQRSLVNAQMTEMPHGFSAPWMTPCAPRA